MSELIFVFAALTIYAMLFSKGVSLVGGEFYRWLYLHENLGEKGANNIFLGLFCIALSAVFTIMLFN